MARNQLDGNSTPKGHRTLVWLDPDVAFVSVAAWHLERHGWKVVKAGKPSEVGGISSANACLLEVCPHGVLRLDLLDDLLSQGASLRVLILTSYPSVPVGVECLRRGARDYLAKPLAIPELLGALEGKPVTLDADSELPSLARVEWEYVQRVFAHTRHNVTATARILRVQRSTLQRKLRRVPPRA